MIENTTTLNNASIDAATATALQQIQNGEATLVKAPKKVSGKQVAITAGVGAASAGAGFAAGYFVARAKAYKTLKEQVEDLESAVAEIASAVVDLKKENEEYFVEEEPETPTQPEADKAEEKK